MGLLKRLKLSYFFILLMFLYPLFVGGVNYFLYSGSLILIYIIIAMSLNLLLGYGGQISIGHASFLAIGAYSSAILTLSFGLPFVLALPLSGLFTALVGFIVGLPAVKLSGHFLAVATLGFGVAIPELLLKWDSVTGGFSGLFPEKPVILGYAFDTDMKMYFLLLVAVLLITWLMKNLIHSRIGRAFVAIRESEIAATAMGINVPLYKALMFSLSAFYTGLAGSLYAHFVSFISPHDFNISISFIALAMVVVGGFASIPGSYIGAILLTMIPQLTEHIPGLSLVLTGVALVAVILFLPNGLVTIHSKWREKKGGYSDERLDSNFHGTVQKKAVGSEK
ncbi:branched-chain amino acid ABC transporter permease [Effusibacillus consociatus]|uniref:Branched-chain amino acid ABC transporter permease n=1 Tax=Effusibacillus consociatus TaxID=1117041 RepID=A0ABV9Q5B8_9BACL